MSFLYCFCNLNEYRISMHFEFDSVFLCTRIGLSTELLLHLLCCCHLRRLRLVGLLQDDTDNLLSLQVLRDASIRACHFSQTQIGFFVLAVHALFKARGSNLVEKIGIHFHFRLGCFGDRVRQSGLESNRIGGKIHNIQTNHLPSRSDAGTTKKGSFNTINHLANEPNLPANTGSGPAGLASSAPPKKFILYETKSLK